MFLLKIFLTSIFSLIVLFLLTKLVGNTQMSELNMFEYINGITIGSIAAEMATSLEKDIWASLIAMLVYGFGTSLIAYIGKKSIPFRRAVSGTSTVLYDKGILYRDSFSKSKLDITDFLVRCRVNGYFNLADIETAILEPNGMISILPKAGIRPLSPNDLAVSVDQNHIVYNVIIDGKIEDKNLTAAGRNTDWLNEQLKLQKINSVRDVLLATCDSEGNLSVYPENRIKTDNDPFQ